MKLLVMMLSLFLSTTLFSATVLSLKGTAFFQGKALKIDNAFEDEGKLTTGDNSYVKISQHGSTIILGSNSEMLLKEKTSEVPGFTKGLMRWVSGTVKKTGPTVKTANAAMGVRGTDFLVVYNELLGESEIICFSGSVDFSSGDNSVLVSKNQWGGVGGRFGSSIGKVLTLPENVIKHFNEALPK